MNSESWGLKCRGGDLMIGKKTIIMGVLNVTPDSFSDGGLYYKNVKKSVEKAIQMYQEGADIIDVGGESTRPFAERVSEEEELRRVIPVIKGIKSSIPQNCFISIDTYKEKVARKAIEAGADMINTLSGESYGSTIFNVAREYGCPIILYYIRGTPVTMQKGKIAYKDVVEDIIKHFKRQIELGISKGLNREQFLIDPGIGFGKTVEQNLEIVKKLSEFKSLRLPIVIGVSRKSHLGIILKDELKLSIVPSPAERLEASLAETAVAVLNGASVIRTHDVLQTKKFLAVLDKLK